MGCHIYKFFTRKLINIREKVWIFLKGSISLIPWLFFFFIMSRENLKNLYYFILNYKIKTYYKTSSFFVFDLGIKLFFSRSFILKSFFHVVRLKILLEKPITNLIFCRIFQIFVMKKWIRVP